MERHFTEDPIFVLASKYCLTPVIPSYRELMETLDYQDLQGRPDWLVCLDPWDLLGHPDLLDLLDQVIVLDLYVFYFC